MQWCCNKAGKYVAIVEYGEGRRKRVVMVPEDKNESGWMELTKMFQEVMVHLGKHRRGRGVSSGSSYQKGISFVDVVKARPMVKPSDCHVPELENTVGEGFGKLKLHGQPSISHATMGVDSSQ